MAVSKTKHLEAAQKYLSQGKLAQAIAEYQQILQTDPKDQNAMMTVGDLYVRQGDTHKAVEYFERLAEVFLQDGFLTKAIAIYKKIVKLAPSEVQSLERLAELYVQQGVLSEARPIFLQLAEAHLKAKRSEQAVHVLEQLLEVEPENLRAHTRLAELYQALGKQREAAQTYLTSAQRAIERGEFAEAQKTAERALHLDPKNPQATLAKVRALAANGKATEAIKLLTAHPEVAASSDATELLVELHLKTGQAAPAAELARKALERQPNQHALVFRLATGLLDSGQTEATLDLLGGIREAMVEAGETEKLSQALTNLAERMPGRLEPLEWLAELCRKTNDSFRLPEVLEQLAQATADAGQLKRSHELFQELVARDPQNDYLRRGLNKVRVKLGLAPLEEPLPAEEEAPVEEVAEAAPLVPEPPLDEETQRFINQSLVDVDLFASYGLPQKAVNLLESVLPRAPRHVVILEKLLDLYLGTGDERRTAALASQLEQIHRQRGDQADAERFFELRKRFQKAAGLSDADLPVVAPPPPAPAATQEFAIPTVEAEPAPEPEPAVHEVDLSAEWATLTEAAPSITPAASPADDQAAEPAPVEAPAQEFPLELSPAVLPPGKIAEAEMTTDDLIRELAAEVEQLQSKPAAAEPPPLAPTPEAPAAPPPLKAPAVPPRAPAQKVPATPPRVQVPAAPPPAQARAVPLPTQAPPPRPAIPPPSAPTPSSSGGSVEQLREVFEEFRSELGEGHEAEEEDLETHYNLGIAYREMGLLEEAIGEFQRVAKAIQADRPFRYTMQCYTLLGLAFMEKGDASIATMWYQKALETPGLDQESVLALRYDLGVAHELAGNPQAALESFHQVYAMNIDYRDVAERIATLTRRR